MPLAGSDDFVMEEVGTLKCVLESVLKFRQLANHHHYQFVNRFRWVFCLQVEQVNRIPCRQIASLRFRPFKESPKRVDHGVIRLFREVVVVVVREG